MLGDLGEYPIEPFLARLPEFSDLASTDSYLGTQGAVSARPALRKGPQPDKCSLVDLGIGDSFEKKGDEFVEGRGGAAREGVIGVIKPDSQNQRALWAQSEPPSISPITSEIPLSESHNTPRTPNRTAADMSTPLSPTITEVLSSGLLVHSSPNWMVCPSIVGSDEAASSNCLPASSMPGNGLRAQAPSQGA